MASFTMIFHCGIYLLLLTVLITKNVLEDTFSNILFWRPIFFKFQKHQLAVSNNTVLKHCHWYLSHQPFPYFTSFVPYIQAMENLFKIWTFTYKGYCNIKLMFIKMFRELTLKQNKTGELFLCYINQ